MIIKKEDDVRMIVNLELLPVMKKLDELISKVEPNRSVDESEFLYLIEAAEKLEVHPSTVVRYEKMGFFTRRNRIPNSPIYYLKSDIMAFKLNKN